MRRLGRMPGMAAALAVGLVLAGWAVLRPGAAPPGLPADIAVTPLPPSGDPLRLAVFGTSLTAGSTWPEALAGALSDCLGRPVTLLRFARPGATTGWAMDQVAGVIAAAPDIVLIEFAINDADLHDGYSASRSLDNHRAILAAMAAGRPAMRRVLMTMSPAQGLRGLVRPGLARHYAGYRTLAAEGGTGLVDLYPRWLALPPDGRGLDDGLHPRDAVALSVILPALLPYLAQAAGGACATG